MKVLLDVNQLVGSKTKSGIYLYITNILFHLAQHEEIEKLILTYHFSPTLNLEEIPSNSRTHLKPLGIRYKPIEIRQSKLLSLLATVATRRTAKIFNYFSGRFFAKALDCAEIYHNPSAGWIHSEHWKKKHNVITIHDAIPLRFPSFFPATAVSFFSEHAKKALLNSDRIIVPSQHTKNDLTYFFKTDASKIKVIPYGIREVFQPHHDLAQWERFKTQYQVPDPPFILSIRSEEPRKNLGQVIRCFAQLIEKSEFRHLKLVLYGGAGPYQNKDISPFEWKRVQSNIVSLPYIPNDELPILYSKASAFIFLSLYEGFGCPPLEAMACGAPVICANNSSLPEVIGDAGILVDPRNIEEVNEQIIKLLADSDHSRLLSQKGIARSKQFSWQVCVDQTVAIYKEAF